MLSINQEKELYRNPDSKIKHVIVKSNPTKKGGVSSIPYYF